MQDARIGTFDGLDNRRWLMEQLDALGHGLDERRAGMRRAEFLRSLMPVAHPAWQGRPVKITPCATVEAYHLLIAMVSGLGVMMETAARRLEEAVRAQR